MNEFPPPGWYDDPEGKGSRWWDGSDWTEHRQGSETTEATQPRQAPAKAARGRLDPVGLAVAGVGGVLALIGVFLPQLSSTTFVRIADNSLMQNGDGWIVLGALAVAGVAVYTAYRGSGHSNVWPIIAGVVILGVAIYNGTGSRTELQSLAPTNQFFRGLPQTEHGSPGVGLYVTGIGGALLALGGYLLWRRRVGAEPEPR